MPQENSYIVFADAKANNAQVEKEARNAVDIGSDNIFLAKAVDGTVDGGKELELECKCDDIVSDSINVLEIAFAKGKYRRTKFSVDYLDEKGEKRHVGTFESSGRTNNYEKFVMPDKIQNFIGLLITFKSNDDGWPYFAVKGIRIARFVNYTTTAIDR